MEKEDSKQRKNELDRAIKNIKTNFGRGITHTIGKGADDPKKSNRKSTFLKLNTEKMLALIAAGTFAGAAGATQLVSPVHADAVAPTTQSQTQDVDQAVNSAAAAKSAAQSAADQAQQTVNADSGAVSSATAAQSAAQSTVNNAQSAINSASDAVASAGVKAPTSADLQRTNDALTSAQGTVKNAQSQLDQDSVAASAAKDAQDHAQTKFNQASTAQSQAQATADASSQAVTLSPRTKLTWLMLKPSLVTPPMRPPKLNLIMTRLRKTPLA